MKMDYNFFIPFITVTISTQLSRAMRTPKDD